MYLKGNVNFCIISFIKVVEKFDWGDLELFWLVLKVEVVNGCVLLGIDYCGWFFVIVDIEIKIL